MWSMGASSPAVYVGHDTTAGRANAAIAADEWSLRDASV